MCQTQGTGGAIPWQHQGIGDTVVNNTDRITCHLIPSYYQASYHHQIVPHCFHFIDEKIKPFVQDHSVVEVTLESHICFIFQRQTCFYYTTWCSVSFHFQVKKAGIGYISNLPWVPCILHTKISFISPSSICLKQLLSNHHAQWLYVAPGSLAILSFFLHFRLITEVTQKVFRGSHTRAWDLFGIYILRINHGLYSILFARTIHSTHFYQPE